MLKRLLIRNVKTGQFANCGTPKRLPVLKVRSDGEIKTLEQLMGYLLFSFKDRARDVHVPFYLEAYGDDVIFRTLVTGYNNDRKISKIERINKCKKY